MNKLSRGQDPYKNKFTIQKEVDKLNHEIAEKKQRIKFLKSLYHPSQIKELTLGPRVVIVVGEKAQEWVEENCVLFHRKKLITHEEFEKYKDTPKNIELIIMLGETENSTEIIKYGKRHKISIDYLN